MKLYDLGCVPWLDSQLLYHALPRVGGSGLILLAPATPYVCIGRHQDPTQEVDLDFCAERGIPVFRREVGGGAVYLDGDQLFYQLVLPLDHPLGQGDKESVYRRLLAPVVQTYQGIGIDAHYKPVNDILAGGRKISGNGAAEIEGSLVLVGNLILDFDYEMMSRVLRVPDEKFRDRLHKTLQDNLTTVQRELGGIPEIGMLKKALVSEFERLLGPLETAPLPQAVYDKAHELAPMLTSREWLMQRGRRSASVNVKLRAGVNLAQRVRKAPGGLIRSAFVASDGRLEQVEFSGDFFFYPAERLAEMEKALIGVSLTQVKQAIQRFYDEHAIQSPGVTPADFAAALQPTD